MQNSDVKTGGEAVPEERPPCDSGDRHLPATAAPGAAVTPRQPPLAGGHHRRRAPSVSSRVSTSHRRTGQQAAPLRWANSQAASGFGCSDVPLLNFMELHPLPESSPLPSTLQKRDHHAFYKVLRYLTSDEKLLWAQPAAQHGARVAAREVFLHTNQPKKGR